MSSSGPLRPHHHHHHHHPALAAVAASGLLKCASKRDGDDEEDGAGDNEMTASAPPTGLVSLNSNRMISSRVVGQVVSSHRQEQHHPRAIKKSLTNIKTTKLGRMKMVNIPTSSTMTSTRLVSGFMFNLHFPLSIVLLIVLCGDLATLRTDGGFASFGGVWAEELSAGQDTAGGTAALESFDPSERGQLKFGDKCESTTECGFAGSICDPQSRTCQCTPDLSATNHIDKCGKEKVAALLNHSEVILYSSSVGRFSDGVDVLYMNFMFDLEDASNDGGIDAEEFSIVCSSYGPDKQECQQAFRKMAQGSDEVNREQFAELWREYFSTDDPTAPGNFIFGKTAF
ncbi:uncharacterized protein LOC131693544 [Topomyia yanbarensis]|uniref:uncharacterized protein LOC131693544 n=1 Tax=Topomyia yanbarensis TaxID=2498891 RepID=UPI00273B1B01|nr:uncharacterized protein LOC131693544 [Topomyia yanbarensis]